MNRSPVYEKSAQPVGADVSRIETSRAQETHSTMPELAGAGRYMLGREIAAGGMARVHVGWLQGPAGFSRVVAIKRLLPHYALEPEFVSMLLDEARVAAQIQHPNVVATLDIVRADSEVLLVMEYVRGISLAHALRECAARRKVVPPAIAAAIAIGILEGLDAAHRAVDAKGVSLQIIHRDVSPQNILVGADGIPRLADFGIAKAKGRLLETTGHGVVKGKSAYMAPEQLRGRPVDQRVDVYAVAVVLWEMLVGERLFEGGHMEAVLQVLEKRVPPPHERRQDVPQTLSHVVMKGLSRDQNRRFTSAREMAHTLEAALTPASRREIETWVGGLASERLVTLDEMTAQPHGATVNGVTTLSKTATFSQTTTERSPPTHTRRVRPVLIGAALVAAVVAVFTTARGRATSTPVADTAARAASVASASPAPSSEAAPPLPVQPEMRAPSVIKLPDAPVVAAPPAGKTAPPRRSMPTPARKVGPGCDPPFRIDSDGVRIPKPNCF